MDGVEKILRMTVELHSEKVAREEELVADTTVQEANIQFPTDTRLHVDCIEKLWRMGKNEGLRWRRNYARALPCSQCLPQCHPSGRSYALHAALFSGAITRPQQSPGEGAPSQKTIAGRLLRDFRGSMGDEGKRLYAEELALIERMLRQKRHDKVVCVKFCKKEIGRR